jgi:hypothetical protein
MPQFRGNSLPLPWVLFPPKRHIMRFASTAPTIAIVTFALSKAILAQGIIHTISGNNDDIGSSVAAAGDLNADGFDDVLVGAPKDDAGAVDAGSVRAVSGFDAQTLLVVNGIAAGSYFGSSLRTIGDVNADGFIDWVAGGPGGSGYAHVVSSATGAVLYAIVGSVGENFGFSVAGVGDVDGNGISDIVVGAPAASGNFGAAYAYLLPASAPSKSYFGVGAGGMFGFAVAGPGDVDGDGTPDIAVGAPKDGQGLVKVFRGVTSSTALTLAGTCPDCITDPGIKALFGQSLAATGDLNHDGYADIAVGTIIDGSASEAWDSAGQVFSGSTGLKLFQVHAGGPEWSGFSSQLGAVRVGDAVGDLDGDGQSDLLVSSAGVLMAGGSNVVRAYSVPSLALIMSTNKAAGGSCSGAGDVNGDGYADIIAGSPGKAFVLSTECHSSSPYGAGCQGHLSKAPSLSLAGCFVPGGTLTLRLDKASGTTNLVLLLGGHPASIPLIGDCVLLVAPPFASLVLPVPPSGVFSQMIKLPITATLTSFYIQGFVTGGVLQSYAATGGIDVKIN